ncbi:centromere protein V isoform X5 [Scophthalmus maximus]|uniref:centromere protein V isoform X5 n=1 Tax=Scophthalmus maximus TaxID=52904 RepID=UPI0015E0E828|nr:centromere protein V isoform X5 [Scophthalmus maximus]
METCLVNQVGCLGWNAQFHVSRFHNQHTVTPVSPGPKERAGMDLVKHKGGCHCEAVRFEVWSSPDLHVFHCNCSICTKKQNHHFIVPKNHFTLLQHTFCKTCGVQSFYTPRSNPDGYGIAPHCLDPGTVRSVTVEKFCGEKWEESMQAHKTIRDMS